MFALEISFFDFIIEMFLIEMNFFMEMNFLIKTKCFFDRNELWIVLKNNNNNNNNNCCCYCDK